MSKMEYPYRVMLIKTDLHSKKYLGMYLFKKYNAAIIHKIQGRKAPKLWVQVLVEEPKATYGHLFLKMCDIKFLDEPPLLTQTK